MIWEAALATRRWASLTAPSLSRGDGTKLSSSEGREIPALEYAASSASTPDRMESARFLSASVIMRSRCGPSSIGRPLVTPL